MNTRVAGLRHNIPAPRWRTVVGSLLIYCALLTLVGSTVSFSEEDAARRFIAQLTENKPSPLPRTPTLRVAQWPDFAMRRDPFQLPTPVPQQPAESSLSSQPLEFVATYSDKGRAYALGHRGTQSFERFSVGDDIDGRRIERIDANSVVLTSHGQQSVVEITRSE